MKETWKTLGIKDKIQYISAMALIASGIILAFVCAIFNFWEITTGVLIYVAQAFITAGSIFGISVYFKTQLGEFESRQSDKFKQLIINAAEKIEERKKENETNT